MDPVEIVDPGAFWRGFFQSRPYKEPRTSLNSSRRCLKVVDTFRSGLTWRRQSRIRVKPLGFRLEGPSRDAVSPSRYKSFTDPKGAVSLDFIGPRMVEKLHD